MKKLSFILLFLILFTVLLANISEYYTFTPTTGTYTQITGTEVPSAVGENVISIPIDIGFLFPYGTDVYTQVKICSYGFVALGTGVSQMPGNVLNSTYYCPVLAPLWDDNDMTGGSVQTLLEGNAPDRIFTVQFTHMRWNFLSTSVFDFQVKLYENRRIEFIYGDNTGEPRYPNASIGINMPPGGSSNFISVTPGNPATSSNTTENNSISTWPGESIIYQFNPFPLVPNDMMCLSLAGNTTPSVGLTSDYVVTIRNMGTDLQDNYTVKLMDGNIELASVQGPAIPPLTTLDVTVPWTPVTAGALSVSAKVALASDTNPGNDQSGSWAFVVQPAGSVAITVGMGNEQAEIPVDMSMSNSVYECIIPAAEIGTVGTIYRIAFYSNFPVGGPPVTTPTRIWLGMTELNDLSAGFIPSTSLTQVFDADVLYETGQNTVMFAPIIPFNYTGGNLVIMCNRQPDTANYYDYNFFCQTVGTNRARYFYGGAIPLDPSNLPNGYSISGQYPKTTLYLTSQNPNPVFSVSPASKNWGTSILNNVFSQDFTIFNSSVGSLTVDSIALSGSPMFSLQNMADLPDTIISGESSGFTVHYQPTTVGIHTATVTITDNLTRTQHDVQLSGTGFDPTINTLPYAQNFDAGVILPLLPVDWQKVQQSTTGYIDTFNGIAHSAPNCIAMRNQSDQYANLQLISPPIVSTIPINTVRVRFQAKSTNNNYLKIGVVDNPLDANSFTLVQTIHLSNIWAAYYVDLQTYSGEGHYISFKHGSTATNQSIFIDDISIELIPQNDLAALSVEGDGTPHIGVPIDYTVSVFNWGVNSQSNYLVKLFTLDNIEVSSVGGPVIEPFQTLSVAIRWTPAVSGLTSVYGKVVLTGDQNTSNDISKTKSVNVLSADTIAETFGYSTGVERYPFQFIWRSNLYEVLFTHDELGFLGSISGIAYYNDFTSDNVPNESVNIWIGMTSLTDLSDGWIPSNAEGMTLAFSGLLSFPVGQNDIFINFNQPFSYTQGNLVIMIQREYGPFYTGDTYFRRGYIGTSLFAISNEDNINPANPPTGNNCSAGGSPKISFMVIPYETGQLQGTVYHAISSQPISGAVIHINGFENAISDSLGHYTFPLLPTGTYQVSVAAQGYASQTQSVSIQSEQIAYLSFNMISIQTGTLSGTVSDQFDEPLMNAVITAGLLTATTTADGSYILNVQVGTYSVTCTAEGYLEQTQNNIVVTSGQTTNLNFHLSPVYNADEVAVKITALKSNYPNPFNPETTINYDVKDRALIRIDIYNLKGQLVRNLVNEVKSNGHHTVVWNGKDQRGNAVASGIYSYRMQAGDYQSTRRMMLMK